MAIGDQERIPFLLRALHFTAQDGAFRACQGVVMEQLHEEERRLVLPHRVLFEKALGEASCQSGGQLFAKDLGRR